MREPVRYETCEIDWERVPHWWFRTTYRFIARGVGPKGEYVAAASEPWNQWFSRRADHEGPDPRYAKPHHERLVRELAVAEWEHVGRSDLWWWKDRFRRPAN